MNEKVKEKIKESLSAILPIVVIVLVLAFTITPLSSDVITMFFIGAVMLIVGMGLFTLGAEISMSTMGEKIGAHMAKSKNILFIFIVLFILGAIFTSAEPDLRLLASQIIEIESNVIIISVSVGVGLFLALAFLRIIFKINLSHILFFFYGIIFILFMYVPKEFWAIAFDSGGVTVGAITVPFLISLGIGAAEVRGNKNSENDSFGLVAICSIGPIITMGILGIIYNLSDATYSVYTIERLENTREIAEAFISNIPTYLLEAVIAVGPVFLFFMIYQCIFLKLSKQSMTKILVGVGYTFLGLLLFLLGVNVGFLPAGYLMGQQLATLEYNWTIIPIGMIIGYFVVIAEPAVLILIRQISDLTDGAIPERAMKFSLSISVAVAIGIAMIRLLTGVPIVYFLVIGYGIALLLSLVTPSIFTAIAFDSGGVTTGPIMTTFLIPFSIGICTTLGGNVLTDAFGLVALAAMTPLIVVQITGLVYKIKFRKIPEKNAKSEENEIIEIDWKWEDCLN